MRVLHTSDWHLGTRLCDRDRIDEHRFFLNWLLETIVEKSIDILLIAGDVFDSTNPPHYAEQLYYDFICSVKETNCRSIIIIGGNHDSISKLNSPKVLLRRMSVYINGGINETPDEDVLEIRNDDAQLIALVCAVPFLRERDIHIPIPGETWRNREESVLEGIRTYYKKNLECAVRKKGESDVPIIAMGHLFAAGSLEGAGQRDLYVGNLGSVSGEIFPDEFAYIALGHIHRPQKIGGKEHIRYCGSPIHMDFGENGDKKVLVVDFDGSQLTEVKELIIPLSKDLIRFKGTFEGICKDLNDFSSPDIPFWADAEVMGGDSTGDVSKILNEKAAEKGFEFLRIKILNIAGERVISGDQVVEINDLTVEEVFLRRCEKAQLTPEETDELLPLHNELLIGIENED